MALLLSLRYWGFLKKQATTDPPFDTKRYLFFSIFIILLQCSLTQVAGTDADSWKYGAGFLVSLLFLWLYIRSARRVNPLIGLGVFTSRTFVHCCISIIILSLALYGGLFLFLSCYRD